MKARELFNRRVVLTEQALAELVLWEQSKSPLREARIAINTGWYLWSRRNVCCATTTSQARATTSIWGQGSEIFLISVDELVADSFEDAKRWRDENSND